MNYGDCQCKFRSMLSDFPSILFLKIFRASSFPIQKACMVDALTCLGKMGIAYQCMVRHGISILVILSFVVMYYEKKTIFSVCKLCSPRLASSGCVDCVNFEKNFIRSKCSPEHVECSFGNTVEKFSLEVRKLYAQ